MTVEDKLKAYKQKHTHLFWDVPTDKRAQVSDAFLLETILNYGTMDDVRELIAIMGKEQIAQLFFAQEGRAKNNYYPEIYNFFNLLFSTYVQRDTK